MAKEVRSIIASDDVAGLIDRGADVDTQLKNLTYEDKGIKSKLGAVAGDNIQEGETSVRLRGSVSAAVVSAVEKLELNANAENFGKVRMAQEQGLLTGILEKEQTIVVPPAEIDRAVALLKSGGINVLVAESYTIDSESLKKSRAASVSFEHEKAARVLETCLTRTVSYRVKYEKRKEE